MVAYLFKKLAAVDYIPGEDDVDPELLEEHAAQPDHQDYRDSNADSREGNHITGSVIPKEATELVRWASNGRAHIALKVAGTKDIIASWWDEHVSDAIDKGDLNPEDMHTSAYHYAAAHKLLPAQVPPVTMGKKAALFGKALTLEFVNPDGPGWDAFVEKLRHLPEGSKIQTQDGYTLTKEGDTFGDGDILFMLQDFNGAAKELLPPVAIKQAGEGTFLGQSREDGSWAIQQVPADEAEDMAERITNAPDGNKAKVYEAPDGDAARGILHEDMVAAGDPPIETTGFVRPTASVKHVLKAGAHYLHVEPETATVTLVDKQAQATRFTSKQAAILWKASEGACRVAVEVDSDVRVVALK